MKNERPEYELNAVIRTPAQLKVIKRRNIALAVILIALVGIFFSATLIQLGANFFNRPI